MTNLQLPTQTLIDTLTWAIDQASAPARRPISQWVEQEIILPNGPYSGERYRHSRHPVSSLWFEQLDSGRWSRFAASGPTQNGKTLMCYVAPVLYHLFEIGETVIIGLPNMDMANDKWTEDFLPVIEASRFRDLLPTKGEGSRGGQVKRAIRFRNGATLRFMGGGGGDKKRAGYTSRVVAVTETDGMDEPGEASREADKIEQLEGRTRAFGRHGKRIYLECTVSIERGRIWQEIVTGTHSTIVRPCPHCCAWVSPERDHLQGWQSATSEGEAADKAYWSCPECSQPWTEQERRDGWHAAQLVHRGQEITPEGEIVGEPPKTQTLGFRWSAIDNPFCTAADLGAEEWLSRKSRDRDNAEKKMRQFVWCLPYEPPVVELTPLDPDAVRERQDNLKRGQVPEACRGVAVQVDTGKRALHWVAMAITEDGSGRVIEYGRQTVEADRLGVYRGLIEALEQLASYLNNGWRTAAGALWTPQQVWIDSGYHEHTDAVYSFCGQANSTLQSGSERYRPSKGYGEKQARIGRYVAPDKRHRDIMHVGREYHIARVRRNGKLLTGVQLVHVNADAWKSELHQRLAMDSQEPGAVLLYRTSDPFEHGEFVAHLTAEKQVETFVPGRGLVVTWDRIDRNNHYLDAAYGALAAGDLIMQLKAKPAARQQVPGGSWFGAQKKR